MDDRQPPGRKIKLLPTALKFAFGITIIALLLIYKTSVKEILAALSQVDPAWLAAAFSLHAVGLYLSGLRWQILAGAQGDAIPLAFLIKSYLVGTFFNNFLPTSFGGDIVRIWDGSRYSRSLLKSSAIVVVERVTGIAVLFLFALFGSLFRLGMARQVPVIWVSLLIGLCGLALIVLFLIPPARRVLDRIPERRLLGAFKKKMTIFRETVLLYKDRKSAFARATVLAVILQVNVVLYFFLIGKAFHLNIRFPDYFIIIPIVLLVQSIPITINGLGLREGSTIEIFQYYAIPAQTAFSFSLVDVAFRLILGIAGGIIYCSRK